MKVLNVVLRGGSEIRRFVTDEACAAILAEIEARVGAVPLDTTAPGKRRRSSSSRRLIRQADVSENFFYLDPEEIAALTVDELELKDF